MTRRDFKRLLETMLLGAGPTSLTLTELPPLAGDLRELIEDAILSGRRHGSRLTQIQLPAPVMAGLGAAFTQVVMVASVEASVMRLNFQPEDTATAAPAE